MRICHVRGHVSDAHCRMPNERNNQQHRLSLANMKVDRIRVSHQGGSMISLFTQNERWKTLY